MSLPTKITVTATFTPKTEAERDRLIDYLKKAPAVFDEYHYIHEYSKNCNDVVFRDLSCADDDLRYPEAIKAHEEAELNSQMDKCEQFYNSLQNV